MNRHALAVISIGLLSLSTPLAADWLVTADGALVETIGPWQVQGGQVVFTLPNGTWASMRATEVNLNASEAETVRANAPPAPPAPVAEKPKREAVWVLTDDDIPQYSEAAEAPDEAPAASAAVPQGEPVKVISWRETDGAEEQGLELRGVLRNTGNELAAGVGLTAEVKNEDGEVLMSASGFLQSRSLLPGKSTTFKVLLPDVYDFAGEPDFTVTSEKVTVGSTNPESQVTGEDIDAGVAEAIKDRKEQQGLTENGTNN